MRKSSPEDPQHPEPPLNYQIVYSLEGALDYYTTPSWVLRQGKAIQVDALSELEPQEFPAPVGNETTTACWPAAQSRKTASTASCWKGNNGIIGPLPVPGGGASRPGARCASRPHHWRDTSE